MSESVSLFECASESLLAITHTPTYPSNLAIIIVVGGPQYRIGSHRQFVRFARAFCDQGYTVLRFDMRGMGHSTGERAHWRAAFPDISSAVTHLLQSFPQLSHIALLGLCDGATLSALYAAHDPRIHHLILLNPWLEDESISAKAQWQAYYAPRLRDPREWLRWLRHWGSSLRSLIALLGKSPRHSHNLDELTTALHRFTGRVLLVLSGRDFTAAHFQQAIAGHALWQTWLRGSSLLTMHSMTEADHTFSHEKDHQQVLAHMIAWLEACTATKPQR